jgi:hypothetical protein
MLRILSKIGGKNVFKFQPYLPIKRYYSNDKTEGKSPQTPDWSKTPPVPEIQQPMAIPATNPVKPTEPIPETEEEKAIRLEKLAKKRKIQLISLVLAAIFGAIGYYFYDLYDQVVKFAAETEKIESHLIKQGGASFKTMPIMNLAYFALYSAFEALDKEKLENVDLLKYVFQTDRVDDLRLLNPNFVAIMAHSCHILPRITTISNGKESSHQSTKVLAQSTLNYFFPVVNQVNGSVGVLNVKIDVNRLTQEVKIPIEGEVIEEKYEYTFESLSISNPLVFTTVWFIYSILECTGSIF